MSAPARRSRPTHVLEVVAVEWRAPHIVRIWAGGDGLAAFSDATPTDRYVKLWFTQPGHDLDAPWDVEELRATLAPEQLPVSRTYSVPVVEAERVAIDVVVHGDVGLAGPWAARAQPGERIVFSGPGGAYVPDPSADAHLLAGDESAIPAIGAALAWMAEHAPTAVGTAYVEVHGAADELPLPRPAGIELVWLHRGDDVAAGTSPVLADAVAAHAFADGRTQVFAHGERESMKAIRDVVRRQGIRREDLSLSGYWAYGRTEDRFQAEKREPIGQIL
ncbi:siderophore-interacting protein [Agrococcus sp. SGAir0287]|uniref:siderophore-interacting protein n=1 Tax=Agrococcus sp. SGAir0287 TaxID=2070347 RepID=UPI0010CD5622|nr:siderophore-interacting protein [Agrococcus sp. SGAir0287]QCR18617.1 NADPH-dependent ferric siderophore reductase [Agrococcus sp. SGAir0287]